MTFTDERNGFHKNDLLPLKEMVSTKRNIYITSTKAKGFYQKEQLPQKGMVSTKRKWFPPMGMVSNKRNRFKEKE